MKVLGSDFDNTIFFLNDPIQTKKNIDAINKFREKGNIFCLITGRTFKETKDIIKELNLSFDYLVCADGAMIFNKDLECIKINTLDQDVALKAIKILKDNDYEPYIENGYEITDTVVDCIKISAEYSKDKEDAIRVAKILNDTLDVYAYASRVHVNVNNPRNHKRQAVIDLSKIINIPLDNFYVIGDSINDYEMIEAYNSAVVKNYNKELESLHPKVCESVAEYIEELMKN